MLPTCPLSVDERDAFLTRLSESLDTFFFVTPMQATPPQGVAGGSSGSGSQTGGRPRPGGAAVLNRMPSPPKSFPPISSGSATLSHFPALSMSGRSMLSHRRGSLQNLNSSPLAHRTAMMKRGTPPLTERRGSLNDLRFPLSLRAEKKPVENIVSFEDMIRNSPNARRKVVEKKVRTR